MSWSSATPPIARALIRVRFKNRVFLIDTGMLSSYYTGGRPSALEIDGGVFTAIYLDHREVLVDTNALDKAAELLPGIRELQIARRQEHRKAYRSHRLAQISLVAALP